MDPQAVFDQMIAEGDMVLDKLDDCALRCPDKVYLHYGEDGIRMSFAEVKHASDRIAAGLVAMGLQIGQPVSSSDEKARNKVPFTLPTPKMSL